MFKQFMGLAILAAASTGLHAAEEAPSIEKLIDQLDAPKFAQREAAARQLIERGAEAVEPMTEAAGSENLEVSRRAIEILDRLYQSPDAEVKKKAKDALERLAKDDENAKSAALAERILAPPVDRQAGQPIRRPGIRVVPIQPGGIQIQGGQIQIAGGGKGMKVVQVKNVNGVRDIKVSEGDRKIAIHDDPNKGITLDVTETVNGKPQTKNYKAKDAAELKKKHPDIAKLYEKYAANNQGVQIQIGRQIGGRIAPQQIPRIVPAPQQPAGRQPAGRQKAIAEAVERIDRITKQLQDGDLDDAARKQMQADLKAIRETLEGK